MRKGLLYNPIRAMFKVLDTGESKDIGPQAIRLKVVFGIHMRLLYNFITPRLCLDGFCPDLDQAFFAPRYAFPSPCQICTAFMYTWVHLDTLPSPDYDQNLYEGLSLGKRTGLLCKAYHAIMLSGMIRVWNARASKTTEPQAIRFQIQIKTFATHTRGFPLERTRFS